MVVLITGASGFIGRHLAQTLAASGYEVICATRNVSGACPHLSVALVWIVTGIVSLGLYPVEKSYALLARAGITGWPAPVLLYGAALLDLAIGIALLVLNRRRWLWLAQGMVILFYSAVIA